VRSKEEKMVYANRFVAAIKVGGKVLREFSNVVKLPFGSEYSLLLKNLEGRRAKVRIWIDGKEVTDGTSLIVDANSSLELERSILNGNLDKGNRLRFVEKTAEIEEFRGNRADDGLIRVEYSFEKLKPVVREQFVVTRTYHDYHDYRFYPYSPYYHPYNPAPGVTYTGNGLSGTSTLGVATGGIQSSLGDSLQKSASFQGGQNQQSALQCYAMNCASVPENTSGITVPGSESNQKFHTASWFATEDEKHVLILQLEGTTEKGTPVAVPVTVDRKPQCQTCGKFNKATDKFCSRCGTALEVI
jgi:hypothetical protein